MHIQAEKETPESARSTATRSTTASFHSLEQLEWDRKRETSSLPSQKNVSTYVVPPRPSKIPSQQANRVVMALKNGNNNKSNNTREDGKREKLNDVSPQGTGVSKRIGGPVSYNRGSGAMLGGTDKWEKAEMASINTPDKWDDDLFVERRYSRSMVEREGPKPAFIPSRRVWGHTISTAIWILFGAGIGFLLGTLCSIITVKATEVVPITFFILPVRDFCAATDPDGITYARKRVEGGKFPNTFVTLKTKMGIVQMQVLGISVFDLEVDTCHVEIQTVNSVIEVLRKTKTILYTRHDGSRETLAWENDDESDTEPPDDAPL